MAELPEPEARGAILAVNVDVDRACDIQPREGSCPRLPLSTVVTCDLPVVRSELDALAPELKRRCHAEDIGTAVKVLAAKIHACALESERRTGSKFNACPRS